MLKPYGSRANLHACLVSFVRLSRDISRFTLEDFRDVRCNIFAGERRQALLQCEIYVGQSVTLRFRSGCHQSIAGVSQKWDGSVPTCSRNKVVEASDVSVYSKIADQGWMRDDTEKRVKNINKLSMLRCIPSCLQKHSDLAPAEEVFLVIKTISQS